ncbi:MAG: hypothetical protein ACLPWS_15035 [Rhodomicrobium sp.]
MGRQIKLREAALACSIALPLVLQVTGAMAFSTEPVAPPQTSTQSSPLSPFGQPLAVPGKTPEASIADPLALTGKSSGTEVTIPGIGSVGTLPKLDFGLELLYGPKGYPDTLQLDQHSLDQHAPDEGMQIKGTLSHKF